MRSNDKDIENKGKPKLYDIVIATGFGAGYWPWGPGTAGAAVATAIWCLYAYAMNDYGDVRCLTACLIVWAYFLGVRCTDRLEKHWGEDPSKVVIDEMAGVWITLLAVPETKEWYYVLAAFVLFRFMDIVKPLGCRWIDRNIHGGVGVMLDDVLAGFYGGIVLYIIRIIVGMYA